MDDILFAIEAPLIALALSNEFLLVLNGLGVLSAIGRLSTLLVALMALIRTVGRRRISRFSLGGLLAFAIWLCAELISSTCIPSVAANLPSIAGLVFITLYPMTWPDGPSALKRILAWLVLFNVPLMLQSFLLAAAGSGYRYMYRAAPASANPIFWARTAAVCAIACAFLWHEVAARRRLRRGALLAVGMAFFTSAAIANSRGPLVALGVSILCAFFLTPIDIRVRGLLCVSAAGVAYLSSRIGGGAYISRLMKVSLDSNAAARVDMWRDVLQRVLTSPIVPLDAASFYQTWGEYPHNTVLEAFLTGGILGGLAYLSMVITSLCTGLVAARGRTRVRAVRYDVIIAVTLAIVDFVSSLFSGTFWSHYFMWLSFGYVLTFAGQHGLRRPTESPLSETWGASSL